MRTADLDYDLPPDRIATRPAQPRDSSRLLVYHRSSGKVEHMVFRELPELLAAGDSLVFNTTSVAPARIIGRRRDSGGRVEGLLVDPAGRPGGVFELMLRGKPRIGAIIDLLDTHDGPSGVAIELIGREGAGWLARGLDCGVEVILDHAGRTPLPPYILKARGQAGIDDEQDRLWYETVYADAAQRRSVAAPTAGFHFTPELLAAIAARGVQRIDVTLHVGLGTFKPIEHETLGEHPMHLEHFEVTPAAIGALASARSRGRIIAVGTTTVRTLESLPDPLPDVQSLDRSFSGETRLLIQPSWRFRHVDALVTNFHLPRSTLMALVAALTGLDRLKEIYAEAISRGYRFYSYGDAMIVL